MDALLGRSCLGIRVSSIAAPGLLLGLPALLCIWPSVSLTAESLMSVCRRSNSGSRCTCGACSRIFATSERIYCGGGIASPHGRPSPRVLLEIRG